MLRNYLLTAYKVFMRRKLFTAINLMCIVLTLVVLLVVTALAQEAFYPRGVEGKSDRMLQVIELRGSDAKEERIRTSPPGFKLIEKYLKHVPGVEAVAAVTMPERVSVYQDTQRSELMLRRADADYWRIMNFRLLAGRLFTADDVAQGRFVAVINQSTARKLFGEQAPLGRKFSSAGQSFAVIGVVEDAMHLNALSDIWVPVTTYPSTQYREQLWGNFSALILARSSDDLPRLRKEVKQIASEVSFDDPREWAKAQMWADSKPDLYARTLLQRVGDDGGGNLLLAGLGGLMLLFMLLPALNLVNLNMGRMQERSAEIGVRKAFGASSAQLAAQLVLENILLCLAGGVLALGGAALALHWLELSGLIPYLRVGINLAVFGWGLLITVIFGVLSGVLPAWKMSRLDPVHALKGAL
ncbi:ABC transporter permease [Massilia sp. NR 4-1]|uniref:ABC transporter permease n=1 Tax=Massilia sp. NR 4-1 TaxID=1678028 RepID=UPI00067AA062|nr:ABC transporter permease [Massilia sp. NR 4-1]AKU21929.1 ABC transporter permease [Massilia sp. NR 4-1]